MKESLSVGSGAIDLTPTGSAFGHDYFDCDNDTYHKCRNGKKKYARWDNYVGDSEWGQGVKKWAQSNPKAPILVRNTETGNFTYLRPPSNHSMY